MSVSSAHPVESAGHREGDSMAVEVKMPQLGETVTEGTILRWAKQVGDSVEEDETLVEISTDKVDTEIPSPAAGVIEEILVEEGETVSVGTAIAKISTDGEAPAKEEAPEKEAEEPPPQPSPEKEEEEPPPQPSPEGEGRREPEARREEEPSGNGQRRVLSPVVRRLAKEHDIELSQVEGSGRGGRITRKDVVAFLEGRVEAPREEEAPAAAVAAPPKEEAPRKERPAEPAEIPVLPGDDVRELERLRARVAENMIRSKQTAAHVWTSVEVDFERVERARRRHREAWKEKEGFSLTYLPFIARATIDALREFPVVNSSFYLEQRKAVFHQRINLGIGVDLDQKGLLVAVIKQADELGLVGLARGVRQLAEKARGGKLEPDDISGSTFTITNPGPFGSFMSAPIINVPNVAILSTDTVTKRPSVVAGPDGEDLIAIRHIGYLGLTWDHRAFDGSTAVLFLRRIKENLEDWDWEQELA
ncbi:MAG: 2-oxoglutarate dehydrogenase, E2 component, dihydrolipoamide succinyltransferase [Acidimicrobiia bacterium]